MVFTVGEKHGVKAVGVNQTWICNPRATRFKSTPQLKFALFSNIPTLGLVERRISVFVLTL